MNRLIAMCMVFAALVAGAFLWQSAQPPTSQAQLNTPDPQAPQTQPRQMTPSGPLTSPAQNTPNFNWGRAKLENERNTIDIVEQSDSSIVFIKVSSAPQPTAIDPNNPLPWYQQQQQQQPDQGTGSGFVISEDGLVLTNNHVVTLESDNVGDLSVKFHDDPKTYPAKVVGRAPAYDVALIRVNAPGRNFKALALGDSDQVRVGQKAIALGNPFGLQFTTTEGIVSATGRTFQGSDNFSNNVIQTDAAVNPGNSGGPLLNSSGEVIGINTAIAAPNGIGQFAGIAFAVPISLVKTLLPELKAGKVLDSKAVQSSRPRLGIQIAYALAQLPPALRSRYKLPDAGIMVASVVQGGPADRAGVRGSSNGVDAGNGQQIPIDGDVITAINGKTVEAANDLQSVVFNAKPGDEVELTVSRKGQEQRLRVQLEVVKER